MNNVNIYRIMQKRIALILLCGIVTGVAVALLSWFCMKNVYQTTSTIIVSSQKDKQDASGITYEDYTLNVKLVNSYQVLCKTDRVLSQVLEETGLNMTVQDLRPKIIVSSTTDTYIISITVRDNSPATAQTIANSLAEVFQREVVSIMKIDNVQIVDYAGLPTEPIAPNRAINVVLAAVAGLLLGLGVVVLLERFNTKVKTVEQAEAIVGAPVLGCIPHIEQ